jgi:hypothetical protein
MYLFNGALLYLAERGSEKCSLIKKLTYVCYVEDQNILFLE